MQNGMGLFEENGSAPKSGQLGTFERLDRSLIRFLFRREAALLGGDGSSRAEAERWTAVLDRHLARRESLLRGARPPALLLPERLRPLNAVLVALIGLGIVMRWRGKDPLAAQALVRVGLGWLAAHAVLAEIGTASLVLALAFALAAWGNLRLAAGLPRSLWLLNEGVSGAEGVGHHNGQQSHEEAKRQVHGENIPENR